MYSFMYHHIHSQHDICTCTKTRTHTYVQYFKSPCIAQPPPEYKPPPPQKTRAGTAPPANRAPFPAQHARAPPSRPFRAGWVGGGGGGGWGGVWGGGGGGGVVIHGRLQYIKSRCTADLLTFFWGVGLYSIGGWAIHGLLKYCTNYVCVVVLIHVRVL